MWHCRLKSVQQWILKEDFKMSVYIHESSYVDENVTVGDGTKIWHFCHIQSGSKIGFGCVLGQNVNISNNVKLGNGVKIQNNVSVYEGVEIEDYVFCGPSCVFTNDLTPRARYPKGKENYKRTLVREGASIGANATIVCGHTIGKYAMIAAGAVVTKDVGDYEVVAGTPAVRIGWVDEVGNIGKGDTVYDKRHSKIAVNSTKKLFITHTNVIIGGANHSLKKLIENLDEKVDLIAPKNSSIRSQVLKEYFGCNINKVYRFDLPFRTSFVGSHESLQNWCDIELCYRKNKKEIMKLISENKYSFVYLNSYVLYPLIDRKYPIYIHVRELCKANFLIRKIIQMRFREAKGIIYIDSSTRKALGVREKSIILNNPFNQKKVLGVNQENIRKKYLIRDNETVFTFISADFCPEKGMDFVADAFINANCKTAKLLIVGTKSKPEYKKYANIIFTGKVMQMEEIYAISDYILRGDIQFCIGRTVYEGLYSGCNIIIPGVSETDGKNMFEFSKFKKNIFFYLPRDTESLMQIIRQRADKKKNRVLGISNEAEYIRRFEKFISADLRF